MTPDTARLAARYRRLPDEELLDAAAAGPDAFRADAWPVVTAELARRGMRVPPRVAPPRPVVDEAMAQGRALLGPWSTGMRAGLLPALAAIAFAYEAVRHFTPVRGLAVAAAFGVGAWIGAGVLVDLVQHRAARNTAHPKRARRTPR